MRISCLFILMLLLALAFTPATQARQAPDGLEEGFLGRYNYMAQRLVALADALPEDKFSWSPAEGVMSMERVFMHIIHYNYSYPATSLGIPAPDGIDVDNLEAMTGKASVQAHLSNSLEHVRQVLAQLSEEDLKASVELYGRKTQAWNVLLQLQTHMGEHLGQLIAYTRMNGVVPPWSL